MRLFISNLLSERRATPADDFDATAEWSCALQYSGGLQREYDPKRRITPTIFQIEEKGTVGGRCMHSGRGGYLT